MKGNRKIITVGLIFALCACLLSACGKAEDKKSESTDSSTAEDMGSRPAKGHLKYVVKDRSPKKREKYFARISRWNPENHKIPSFETAKTSQKLKREERYTIEVNVSNLVCEELKDIEDSFSGMAIVMIPKGIAANKKATANVVLQFLSSGKEATINTELTLRAGKEDVVLVATYDDEERTTGTAYSLNRADGSDPRTQDVILGTFEETHSTITAVFGKFKPGTERILCFEFMTH